MKDFINRTVLWLNKEATLASLVFLSASLIAIVAPFGNIGNSTFTSGFYFDQLPPHMRSEEILQLKTRPYKFGEFFVLGTSYGDSIEYLNMSMGKPAMAPFKFRILVPMIVHGIYELNEIIRPLVDSFPKRSNEELRHHGELFYYLNVILLMISLVYVAKMAKLFETSDLVRFSVLMAFVTQYGVIHTLYFPLLEIPALFLMTLFVYYLLKKNFWALGILLLLMPLCKDVFIIMSPVMAAYAFGSKRFQLLGLAALPLLSFCLLRWFSNTDVLSMETGWNVSQGEVHWEVLKHNMGSVARVEMLLLGVFIAFGFNWAYVFLPKSMSPGWRYSIWTFLALLFVAQAVLSYRVARVYSVAAPLVVLSICQVFGKRNLTETD